VAVAVQVEAPETQVVLVLEVLEVAEMVVDNLVPQV
jgi:hypothetical protein